MLDFRHHIYFQTNASFQGFGAVCPDDWFAGSWIACSSSDYSSPHWSHAGHAVDPLLRSSINYLELFPILLAVCRWGPRWSNKRVCVATENIQAMAFINNGTCKNPIAMSWLREIFWISVRFNFHLRSCHLPGKQNQHADRLSHLQFPAGTNGPFFNPQDSQLLTVAHDELQMKKQLLDKMDKTDKEYSSHLNKLTLNMEKLTGCIAEGFSMLRQIIHPPFSQYMPPASYPSMHSGYTNMSNPAVPTHRPDSPSPQFSYIQALLPDIDNNDPLM